MPGSETFFMCPPHHYGVEYVINPWMEGHIGAVDRSEASRQWEELHRAISARANVERIEPVAELPDMVFTANAGLVYGDTYIPSRFRYPQRKGETPHFTRWATERFDVVELPGQSTFEGEGDALQQPGEPLIWGGYGVRTSLAAWRALGNVLDVEVVPLHLVDVRFYHLDTCFCPLPGGRVFYYPEAFDQESLEVIRTRVPADRRHEVGQEDAFHFACNAVSVDGAVIMNFASPGLTRRLSEWGFEAATTPLSQFMLAGGAAKCLALRLTNPVVPTKESRPPRVVSRPVYLQGHLLDTGMMKKIVDHITDSGCSFEIETFKAGLRHDQDSTASMQVVAPSPEKLDTVLAMLMSMGVQLGEAEKDARLGTVVQDGVAPPDFYSTTIYPTDVRLNGQWVRAENQRMDVVLVITDDGGKPRAACTLMRDLRKDDRIVCGVDGIRIHTPREDEQGEAFEFMSSGVSSERRVEVAIEEVAWEMHRIRQRGGRIAVVAGPVVIHTGAGAHLAWLIRNGFIQALLGGNAIAVHDIEQAFFGTSLGVDMKRQHGVQGGHRHHLSAINRIRECGSIAAAVEQGILRQGVMYECIKHGVPFSLAGSIRDDGPLPETRMDLLTAQKEYAGLIKSADMILMLSTMLHSIGVGNMTPAGARLICVDISPAVVTKLADRGSIESVGIVTDVGLFLNLLVERLKEEL